MTNQTQMSVDNRDIYVRSNAALNGDILTVAAFFVWADDKSSIDGLEVSRLFSSGNHLPVGNLTSFNEYYDIITGVYWFDIKVKPVTEPIDIVLQTSAIVKGTDIPVKFSVHVPGPSSLVVTPITFTGKVLNFEVGTEKGKLLQYPLSILASRNIDGTADPIPSQHKRVPYAFYADIENNGSKTYAVMGEVEVSGIKQNWVARTAITTNGCTVVASQIDENVIGVKVTLDVANNDIEVDLPISYELENGTKGIANEIKDFLISGEVITFKIPVVGIKDQDIIDIQFHLNELNNQSAPIFAEVSTPVKRWNNGQTEIKVVVDSHTYRRNLETIYAHVFWLDGTPANGVKLQDVTPGAEHGVLRNRIVISRKYVPDVHKENTLTLSANLDLSAYGIEHLVPFEHSVKVGSNVFPVRLISGVGVVNNDEVYFTLAVRQNNGDIFNNVRLTKFNHPTDIKQQEYDVDQGILSFSVPNTSITVVDGRANVQLELGVTTDKETIVSQESAIKIDVPYQITASRPTLKYRKDPQSRQVFADITWILNGNDGSYPKQANIVDVKLNGVGVLESKKTYNSTFGALTLTIPVKLEHNALFYVSAVGSASGLGNFINLPSFEGRYKNPGEATYVGHEFIGEEKVKVFFDIQGWSGEFPSEIQLNDYSWDKVRGVKLGKTYSEYDRTKGRLTVTFDIYDIDSSVFEASTKMKFNFSDQTVYPISFSFKE